MYTVSNDSKAFKNLKTQRPMINFHLGVQVDFEINSGMALSKDFV